MVEAEGHEPWPSRSVPTPLLEQVLVKVEELVLVETAAAAEESLLLEGSPAPEHMLDESLLEVAVARRP